MHFSLIIMQSLDGFIARHPKDDLSWGSFEDKNFFRAKTKQIGTMIMGSKTFENMPKFAFKERFSIVLTSNPDKYDVKDYPAEIIFLKSDLNAIFLELEKRKIQKVAVIGGGMINQFFLKEKLINEIFVTIAPKLFLTGIPSFNQLKWSLDQPENLSQIDLELLNFDKLGKNEIHLQYQVLYT